MAKQSKSDQLAAKIAAMQRELEAAKASESDAADRELLRLVHRAGIRDDVIKFAHQAVDQQRRGRRVVQAE